MTASKPRNPHHAPVDACLHDFPTLASEVLPRRFGELQSAMQSPRAATAFLGPRSATRQLLAALNLTAGFSGCYVFMENADPVYVGISRTVIRRLVQHLNSETHFAATLVYKMASNALKHSMRREQAMADQNFKDEFLRARDRLRNMSVAFIPIENDLELYVFEAMAAMSLKTGVWNTFRTH